MEVWVAVKGCGRLCRSPIRFVGASMAEGSTWEDWLMAWVGMWEVGG